MAETVPVNRPFGVIPNKVNQTHCARAVFQFRVAMFCRSAHALCTCGIYSLHGRRSTITISFLFFCVTILHSSMDNDCV